jgi:hypothetical protein
MGRRREERRDFLGCDGMKSSEELSNRGSYYPSLHAVTSHKTAVLIFSVKRTLNLTILQQTGESKEPRKTSLVCFLHSFLVANNNNLTLQMNW